MQIHSKFFVLCEDYTVDDKQRPSIINMYDSIFAPDFPATHQQLKYASNIEIKNAKSAKSVEIQLKLTGPDKEIIFESPIQEAAIVPNMKDQIIGSVFDVQMVPFVKAGRYTAALKVNGQQIDTHFVQLREHLPPEV